MSDQLVVLTDRSRVETYICDCQMKRYLNYHAYGKGIVATTKSYHLEFGIAVHKGIALLLELLRLNGKVTMGDLDRSIDVALADLKAEFERKGMELAKRKFGVNEAQGTKDFYLAEMGAMLEGMMRVWYKVEYPVIKEHYQILAVEMDRKAKVNSWLTLMWKADAIMVKKSTGEGVVYNIKTMKEYDSRQAATRRIALQNFTEVYGAKRWLVKQQKMGMKIDLPKVWNVRLVGLIKGWSRYNKDMERFEIEGPYARYWKKDKDSNAQGPKRIATSKWVNEYGEEKGLYWQAYKKLNTWKVKGGVKEYLAKLERGEIYPGDEVWKQMIVVDGEQMITDGEIRVQMKMVENVELEVRQKLARLKHVGEISSKNWEEYKSVFSTNYNRCYYMDTCPYDNFCNMGMGVKDNPFDNPVRIYEERKPHHASEDK